MQLDVDLHKACNIVDWLCNLSYKYNIIINRRLKKKPQSLRKPIKY